MAPSSSTSYKSGVLTGACGTDLDHGLLAVGFGVDDEIEIHAEAAGDTSAGAGAGFAGSNTSVVSVPYWRLKNDFGLDWGENGFARIARGVAQPGGQCGLLLDASFPVLED